MVQIHKFSKIKGIHHKNNGIYPRENIQRKIPSVAKCCHSFILIVICQLEVNLLPSNAGKKFSYVVRRYNSPNKKINPPPPHTHTRHTILSSIWPHLPSGVHNAKNTAKEWTAPGQWPRYFNSYGQSNRFGQRRDTERSASSRKGHTPTRGLYFDQRHSARSDLLPFSFSLGNCVLIDCLLTHISDWKTGTAHTLTANSHLSPWKLSIHQLNTMNTNRFL